ncbi:MAG: HEPN domain-containing protein [Chloroflexi bacterium]|nr:HEPN domain-containing protein [Chloroflexota bacterium]
MPEKPSPQGTPDQWFTVGGHDFQSAKLLFQQQGPADTITVLIQQAAEKYLKGYLLARGWKLQKTHDLEVLVAEAAKSMRLLGSFCIWPGNSQPITCGAGIRPCYLPIIHRRK